jgi:plastocyanin
MNKLFIKQIRICFLTMAALITLRLLCLTAGAMTTNVVFKDFSFTPQTVTIQTGDTVVWTNGGGTHTVTGDGADPFCGSGAIPMSCSETFTNTGTFPYHCVFHQSLGMVGTVIVLAGTNAPPGTNSSPTEISDPIPMKIPKGNITVELQTVVDGLVSPLGIAAPDDDSGRLFVYDQVGLVHVIDHGQMLDVPLLNGAAGFFRISHPAQASSTQ